jgi:hypothetical protein
VSGKSGSVTAKHTLIVQLRERRFAISPAQMRIVKVAIAFGGIVDLKGVRQLRSAQALVAIGIGKLGYDQFADNPTFTLADGVST